MIVIEYVTPDTGTQFLNVGEHVTVEVLVLEDRPERLDTRVVVATFGTTHGANHLEIRAQGDVVVVSELTPRTLLIPILLYDLADVELSDSVPRE